MVPTTSELIQAAEQAGQEWVLIKEEGRPNGRPFKHIVLHIPTGVAVEFGARWAAGGELHFYTESRFVNRRTGDELACGSRRWNAATFTAWPELAAAVEAAKADVRRRFAGMIRIYDSRRRRRH